MYQKIPLMSTTKISKIKTMFIGTPDFAVPALKKISADSDFEIMAVITQPDKKVGRKQILTPPAVKAEAEKLRLKILQPEKIKNITEEIKTLKPDLIVLIAYRQIIPADILAIPQYGCINIHGSLLPKYRGASCVQAAISNGDEESGITIMKMDSGLDTGPIIKQTKIKLSAEETADSLYEKLANLGAEILPEVLKSYISGNLKPVAQDNKNASYTKELKKEDGKIDWQKNAEEIEKFIRAMDPWPGAFCQLRINNYELRIKILKIEKEILNINKYKPGKFFIHENKLAVQCGKDALIIDTIQPEGKKPMTGKEFLHGNKVILEKI
jgi:methionyl-tRNA formyltransferase